VNFDFSAHQGSLSPPRRLGTAQGVAEEEAVAAVVVVVVMVVAVLVAVMVIVAVAAVLPRPPAGLPGAEAVAVAAAP